MKLDLRTKWKTFYPLWKWYSKKEELLLKYVLFWHLGIQDHICLNLKHAITSYNPLGVTQVSHPSKQKLNELAYTFKI